MNSEVHKEHIIFPHMGWSCVTCTRPFAHIFCRCPYCMSESKEPSMTFIPYMRVGLNPGKKVKHPKKVKNDR